MIEDSDVVVRFVRLPERIHGLVTESPDGWKNIYLNDRLTWEQQLEALSHELVHVEDGDLWAEIDFCEAEGL